MLKEQNIKNEYIAFFVSGIRAFKINLVFSKPGSTPSVKTLYLIIATFVAFNMHFSNSFQTAFSDWILNYNEISGVLLHAF